MTKLTPDDIANLRLLGYSVSNKEGQTFVENDKYIIEEDFGTWFLYEIKGDSYVFLDAFMTVYNAIDYIKDVLE
ncbi:hypothetical protein CPT_CIP9_171 [Enterobacter phage vB_EclM_CIP9]|uniref:Uncharacterized protein n=1 Tax=Enterobacter phage vB_EclM_CIP9 TaxID=2696340 RepID=A0A6B9XX26_9CAUD|nr:hypothetical protein HWD05_gp171 [Enterobacter phage vB_EclM_CIP9]QHS01707.1 hypothetical protein CPT_CIP9_171 [Enterobacter phage vB_EclM_CIP9]